MLLKSQSNDTPNITKSSDSFSTKIVNAGDWGCIVRNPETIIVLVLLAFNFITQRSNHSLTLTRSRHRDSATVTALELSEWSHRHNRSAYSPEWKKLRGAVYGTHPKVHRRSGSHIESYSMCPPHSMGAPCMSCTFEHISVTRVCMYIYIYL